MWGEVADFVFYFSKFEPTLIIIISLSKKNQRSKFDMKVLYQVNFKIPYFDPPNNA